MHWSITWGLLFTTFLSCPGHYKRAARSVYWELWTFRIHWVGASLSMVQTAVLQIFILTFLSLTKSYLSVNTLLCSHTRIAPPRGTTKVGWYSKAQKGQLLLFIDFVFFFVFFLLSKRKTVTVWVSSYLLHTCNVLKKVQIYEKEMKQLMFIAAWAASASPTERQKATWLL